MINAFKIIGIGQCGCRIASEFDSLGFQTYYINSDVVDMRDMRIKPQNCLQLETTGTGGSPLVGKQILEKNYNKFQGFINSIIEMNKMHIIIVGLGGGTGGGMVVPVSEFLIENGYKCGVIATLPPKMLGMLTADNAMRTLRDLRHVPLNMLVLADNEYLISKIGVSSNWWKKINYFIMSRFMGVLDILRDNKFSHSGLGSIDRAEILRILQYGNGLLDIKEVSFSPADFKLEDVMIKERLLEPYLIEGYDYKDTLAYIVNVDVPNTNIEYTNFSKRVFEILKTSFGSAISRLGMFIDPTLEKSIRVTLVNAGLKLPRVLQSRINNLKRDADRHQLKKQKVDKTQFLDDSVIIIDDQFTII